MNLENLVNLDEGFDTAVLDIYVRVSSVLCGHGALTFYLARMQPCFYVHVWPARLQHQAFF